jgi:uncharacterized membrane-anchored protein
LGSALPATSRGVATIEARARVDRRTKNLVQRLKTGEIAVIDHPDLDALAADALAERGAAAVVNASPFISGKYPNRGPSVLLAAGIPQYQLPEGAGLGAVKENERIRIDEDGRLVRANGAALPLTLWTQERIESEMALARANLGSELERFARNTLSYLDSDKDLLLDPTDVPDISDLKVAGRHALVVVRGEHYKDDLQLLRAYIDEVRPVIIAVDGGADALLSMGIKPQIILGDMDSVSDSALRCGARIIVHAYARRGGEAPGLRRVQDLGVQAQTFAVPGTSEDAAMLLAYEHNAELIVAVGTHSNLEDFLDKGRAGMASTFLVRLKVGSRLVDARGVAKLYQPRPSAAAFLAVFLSAMFPITVLVTKSVLWRNIWAMIRIWWQLHWPGIGRHH